MAENKKYTYRIKVEVIGEELEDGKLDREMTDEGIECDGFVILGFTGDGVYSSVHHTTIADIANALAVNDTLRIAVKLSNVIASVNGLMGIDKGGDPA